MATLTWQPAAPAAPTTGSTIAVPTLAGTPPKQQIKVYVQPAGNITGVILAVGTSDGQEFEIINDSAFTITFDARDTSHVADGNATPIAAGRSGRFTWSIPGAAWFRA